MINVLIIGKMNHSVDRRSFWWLHTKKTWWHFATATSPHAIMSSAKTFTKTSSILPNLWRVVSLTEPGLKCQAALRFWCVTICVIQIPSLCNEQDKSEWQTCSLFVNLPLWTDSHWSWERLCIFLTHIAATCLITFHPRYLQGGGSYHVLSGQRGHERHDQRQQSMD